MKRSWYQSCITSFLIQFAIFGLHNNFGIFYRELIKEFNESRAATAWIGSLAMGATFIISPFANMLMSLVGYRVLLTISCILFISSLIATSFVQSVYLIAFTHSILLGFGSGLANHASLVSLQVHAKEKLSLANGISSSGSGIGTFALGPYLSYFVKHFGFRWASRSCLILPLCFLPAIFCVENFKSSAAVNDDVKEHSLIISAEPSDIKDVTASDNNSSKEFSLVQIFKEGLHELVDRDIWKHAPYLIYISGFSIFLFGYFVPFVFLVDHASSNGIPMDEAQFLIGILAIVATIVKVIGGGFLDVQQRIDRTTLFLCSMFGMAATQVIAAYATKYYQFVIFAVLFGICEGVLVGQVPNVVLDVIPKKDKIGVALASLFAVISIPVTAGPVIAGNLSAESHGYRIPFLASAAISFVGAVVTVTIKLFSAKTSSQETSRDSVVWRNESMLCNNDPIFSSMSLLTVTSTPFTRSYNYRMQKRQAHTGSPC